MTARNPTLADQFRDHAQQMQGLYRVLLHELAEDWAAGGVVREICRDWEDAPRHAVVQLRLLAGVQRLVLSGRVPELEPFYPQLGGAADPHDAWPVFRQVLAEHAGQLRQDLDIAPQTNEPGRSVPLLVGLFDAVRRSGISRIRLLEPGASAGLNLLVDRYRIGGGQPAPWWSGAPDSPLQLGDAVHGPVEPVDYTIVARRGCDLAPVNPSTAEGRLRLASFVWPHHIERYQRLQAALRVAAEHPAPVDRAGAAPWLAERLAEPVDHGVLTVVWHSITSQYWPAAEVRRVSELITEAGAGMPIAEVAMEFVLPGADRTVSESVYRPSELTVRLSVPGRVADPEPVLLGTVADHGVPVRLTSSP